MSQCEWQFCEKFFPARLIDGTKSRFGAQLMRRVVPQSGDVQYRRATEEELFDGQLSNQW